MESEECVEISKELFSSKCRCQRQKKSKVKGLFRNLLENMGMYISEKSEDFTVKESERAIKIVRSLKLKDPSFMVIFRKREKPCREVVSLQTRCDYDVCFFDFDIFLCSLIEVLFVFAVCSSEVCISVCR